MRRGILALRAFGSSVGVEIANFLKVALSVKASDFRRCLLSSKIKYSEKLMVKRETDN